MPVFTRKYRPVPVENSLVGTGYQKTTTTTTTTKHTHKPKTTKKRKHSKKPTKTKQNKAKQTNKQKKRGNGLDWGGRPLAKAVNHLSASIVPIELLKETTETDRSIESTKSVLEKKKS